MNGRPLAGKERNSRYRAERYGYALLAKGGYALLRAKGTLLALLCRLFTQHAMEAAAGCADSIAPALWQIENNLTDRLDMDALAAMCVVHGLCRNGAYSCRGKGGHCAAHVCAEPCEQGTYQYRGRAYADEHAP